MDRAKLRELQEKYKNEVRQGVKIEDIKCDAQTRILAEILEKLVPGRGVELMMEVCADPRLGGGTCYLQQSSYMTQSRHRWIRESGMNIEELREVTGMSESNLRLILETGDAAPEDDRQMRLF